jgi:hypothetical protein
LADNDEDSNDDYSSNDYIVADRCSWMNFDMFQGVAGRGKMKQSIISIIYLSEGLLSLWESNQGDRPGFIVTFSGNGFYVAACAYLGSHRRDLGR